MRGFLSSCFLHSVCPDLQSGKLREACFLLSIRERKRTPVEKTYDYLPIDVSSISTLSVFLYLSVYLYKEVAEQLALHTEGQLHRSAEFCFSDLSCLSINLPFIRRSPVFIHPILNLFISSASICCPSSCLYGNSLYLSTSLCLLFRCLSSLSVSSESLHLSLSSFKAPIYMYIQEDTLILLFSQIDRQIDRSPLFSGRKSPCPKWCMYEYVGTYVCLRMCIYVCMNMHVCMHMYEYVCLCVYDEQVRMYVCMYVWMCRYICILHLDLCLRYFLPSEFTACMQICVWSYRRRRRERILIEADESTDIEICVYLKPSRCLYTYIYTYTPILR